MTPDQVSVVIPTINEETQIVASILSAQRAGATEVIVVDGGSQDRTCQLAVEAGVAKLVHSLPGRGIQLNSGARLATQEFLLFLHADNRLGDDCLRQICRHPTAVWGAFHQQIDSDRIVYRYLQWGNAKRVSIRHMAFGDQAMFVKRSVFVSEGGYEEIPLMEDVVLSRRLRRVSKPILLPGPVHISPRRWEARGVVRQTLRNWKLQLAHRLGVRPETLVRWYR